MTPDPYTAIAAELRRIADNLDTLAGKGLPRPFVSLDIQPGGTGDAEIIAAVDTVLTALTGQPGRTYPLSGGCFHHGNPDRRSGAVNLAVFDRVSDPATRDRDAELARLRVELAAVTATAAAR